MRSSLLAITIVLGGLVSVVTVAGAVASGCATRATTSSSTTYVSASGGDAPAPEGAKQFDADGGAGVLPVPDAGVGAIPLEPPGQRDGY